MVWQCYGMTVVCLHRLIRNMAIAKNRCFVMISSWPTGLLLHFAYNQQSMSWNNHFWKSRPLLHKSSSYLNIQPFINQSSQASIIQTHRHSKRSWWIHHMPTYYAKVLYPTELLHSRPLPDLTKTFLFYCYIHDKKFFVTWITNELPLRPLQRSLYVVWQSKSQPIGLSMSK